MVQVTNNKIRLIPSSVRPGCSEGELVLHSASTLQHVENFGDVDNGEAGSNSGYIVRRFGETVPVLSAAPECVCVNSSIRTGSHTVIDPSTGSPSEYTEPSPRFWQQKSVPVQYNGGAAAGGAGDYEIAGPVQISWQAKCYPVAVCPTVRWSRWASFPAVPPDVSGYVEYTVTNGSGDPVTERRHVAGHGTYGGSYPIDMIFVAASESVTISVVFGLQYYQTVDKPFESTLGSADILLDVKEQTSLAADEGVC